MAKSKKSKVVSLTKVKRRGKERKQRLIEDVRNAVATYPFVYLLSLQNQRNVYLKQMREKLKPGRIFYGKNRVMQVALGMSAEVEAADRIYQLANKLRGERGLLFSSEPPETILSICESAHSREFARSGYIATETLVLPEGELPDMPHSIEGQLRLLGLPTLLQHGVIQVLGNYTVCTKGKPLTPAQAQLLKLLGNRMAEFSMKVEAYYHKGEIVNLSSASDNFDDDDD